MEPDNIFQEKFTGTTSKRPQFEALQSKLAGGDELIVAKLDRWAERLVMLLVSWISVPTRI
nr:recombinase family protein [Limosilactobacillus fermentum]